MSNEIYQNYELGQKVSVTERLRNIFQQDCSTYNNPFLLMKEKQLKLMTILNHKKLNTFRQSIERDFQLNRQEEFYDALHNVSSLQLRETDAASQSPAQKTPKVALKLIQEFKSLIGSQQIFGIIHNQQKSEIGNFLVIRNEQPKFELQNDIIKKLISEYSLQSLSAILIRQSYYTRESEQEIRKLTNHIEKLLLFVFEEQITVYLLERGTSRAINIEEVTVKICRNARHYQIK